MEYKIYVYNCGWELVKTTNYEDMLETVSNLIASNETSQLCVTKGNKDYPEFIYCGNIKSYSCFSQDNDERKTR